MAVFLFDDETRTHAPEIQDDRADALNQGASLFEQQAGKLKRKYWWQNLKVIDFDSHARICYYWLRMEQ
jgi:hypothetical protein